MLQGGWLVKIDVDTEKGGLTLDDNFLVHFGAEPHGPVLPHEIRCLLWSFRSFGGPNALV